jgi:hypothetical protein
MWTLRMLAHARQKMRLQPTIFRVTLTRLERDVQCHAVGLFGTFSSETPLTLSSALTHSMKFPDNLMNSKLPKHNPKKRQLNIPCSKGDHHWAPHPVRRWNHFGRTVATTATVICHARYIPRGAIYSCPHNWAWRPIGLWDVKNSTLSRQSAHS